MRTIRRPAFVIASFTLLLTAGAAVPVAAVSPAGLDPSPSGWVVVRKPSVGAYTPKPRDRGNSTGGTVTVERAQRGQWTVTWHGLAAAGRGDLQVSALGSTLLHCLSYTWGSTGSDGYGVIYCYKRSTVAADFYGKPVDAPFVAALVAEDAPVTGDAGRMGYAWMDQPTSDGTPDSTYNYSSAGGSVTVDHTAKGSYTLTVPGIGKADGVPLVTGYVGYPTRCQVRDWSLAGAKLKVRVDCVDLTGALSNEEFDFLYTRHIGLEAYKGGPAASFLANRPTAGTYHPDPSHAWTTAATAATIVRTSKGVYTVKLPGMPSGGAAIVSSYGPRDTQRACQIGSIRTTAAPQQVVVRCFTYGGAPADSRFVFSYTH